MGNDRDRDIVKLEFLYNLIKDDCQREFDRGHKLEEKANRLFTVLNIAFPVLAGIVIKYEFWKDIKSLNFLVIGILCFLVVLIFVCLMSAWYDLLGVFRIREVCKIDLVNGKNYQNIVDCNEKDIGNLYKLAIRDQKLLISKNRILFDDLVKKFNSAYSWFFCAVILFFILLFILFLCYLYKVIL